VLLLARKQTCRPTLARRSSWTTSESADAYGVGEARARVLDVEVADFYGIATG
jgi:hypothetical protein